MGSQVDVDLDNRLFALQQTMLPDDLRTECAQADKAYLQGRDAECRSLLEHIEHRCSVLGITITMF